MHLDSRCEMDGPNKKGQRFSNSPECQIKNLQQTMEDDSYLQEVKDALSECEKDSNSGRSKKRTFKKSNSKLLMAEESNQFDNKDMKQVFRNHFKSKDSESRQPKIQDNYSHIKSRLHQPKKVYKKTDITKEEAEEAEFWSRKSKDDLERSRNLRKESKVEDRLMAYSKNKENKLQKKRRDKKAVEEQKMSCYFQPQILQSSRRIAEGSNTSGYGKRDPGQIFDKLFYQGIELQNKVRTKAELYFQEKHHFHPNLKNGKNKNRVLQGQLDTKAIEEFYQRSVNQYMEKQMKLYEAQKLQETFDEKTSQMLFIPKVGTMQEAVHSLEKGKRAKVKDQIFEGMMKVCKHTRELFRFLDSEREGIIRLHSLDSKNHCFELTKILLPVYELVLGNRKDLRFEDFYQLLLDNDLLGDINKFGEFLEKELKNNVKKPFKV